MKTFTFSKTLLIKALVFLAVILSGQENHLQFRFSNLELHTEAKKMSVDIEVFTTKDAYTLYAMNTHFFYEEDFLEFERFSDFKEGYGFTNESNAPINRRSGKCKANVWL